MAGGAGGCRGRCRCRWRVSSPGWAGSRGCRAGRRPGRRRRTSSPAMARRRAAAAAARSARVRSGARLSHHASYRPVMASRSLGLMVRASPPTRSEMVARADAEGAGDAGGAVAHDVQGAQPQPGAAGVHAGARDGPVVHGEDGGRGAARGPAAAAGQVRDGGGGQACGAGDAAVGAAVLAQAADAGPGRGRPRRGWWPGTAGQPGPDRAGGGVDAHLSSPASAW